MTFAERGLVLSRAHPHHEPTALHPTAHVAIEEKTDPAEHLPLCDVLAALQQLRHPFR